MANNLAEAGIKDQNVLMAALLHDTIEDTQTTADEIESNFGQIIKGIVVECTDDKSLPKLERKQLQIENARTMSFEAKLVRLADKLNNLRDIESVDRRPVDWSAVSSIC